MLLWHAPSRPKTKPRLQPRSVMPLHSAPAMPWHGLPRSARLLLSACHHRAGVFWCVIWRYAGA